MHRPVLKTPAASKQAAEDEGLVDQADLARGDWIYMSPASEASLSDLLEIEEGFKTLLRLPKKDSFEAVELDATPVLKDSSRQVAEHTTKRDRLR
mmetsp:Transcript_12235/g.50543  ORF Transcript_12235/g.50543 Transcript_12235/m.50543 type:complete len:95 (-) Transcript_12235:650-934(-)